MADIKVRLGVDGEASFKQAISDSTSKVKEMKSELGLAQSEYEKTGNKAQYLQDKSNALKDAIQAQNEKIEALKSALDNAKDKYGENSTKVHDWQTKLNNAKTELNGMQTELDNTQKELGELGQSMDDASTDAGELGEALEDTDKKGKFENLKAGLESLSGVIKRVASEAWSIGQNLWNGTKEASDWVDALTTQSQQYGIDRKTLQQWSFASQQIDTSVSTILASRQRMIKNMAFQSKDVEAVWQALGVQTSDGQGGLRDANDVFWEAIEALGQIENEADRDAAAMAIFGRNAAELNPIIKAGREEWERYMQEAEGIGAVLSEDDLNNLQTFNDEWQKLNLQMQSIKYRFYAGLAPGMTIVAKALESAGKQLDAFLQSAEGKAAVEQLGTTIASFVTTLVNKLPELLPLLTQLAKTLTDLLSFVADHSGEIMGILGTLFVGGKAGSAGINAMNLLGGLFGFGKGAAANAGASAAASGAGSAAAGAGGGFLAAAAPAGLSAAGLAAIGIIIHSSWNERANVKKEQNEATKGALWEEAEEIGDTKFAEAWDAVDAARETIRTADEVTAELVEAVTSTPEFQKAAELTGMQGTDWVDMWETGGTHALIQTGDSYGGAFGEMKEKLDQLSLEAWEASQEAGEKIGTSLTDGVEAAEGAAAEAGSNVAGAAVEGAESASDNSGAGQNAGQTFVNALWGFMQDAWNAGWGLGNSAAEGLSASLDINSPSRVMREMGGFVAEGFAEGITDGIGLVEDAVYAMSDATVGMPMHHQDGRPGGNMAEMLVNALNGVSVNIDGQVAGRLIAPTVSAVMGDEADAWRYEAE